MKIGLSVSETSEVTTSPQAHTGYMSNDISNKPQSLKALIASEQMATQFAKALPKHLSPERFARIAITALTKTPKLNQCTTESLMKCLLDLSAAGLEPDGRRAYLIPYGKEATVVVSYMGLVELMRRSGDITSIRAETVCVNDAFSWSNGKVDHQVDWFAPRGEVKAVYAEAAMTTGDTQTAVMTKDEVEAIRKRSRAGKSGPWVTDWGEMAKKTVVRRLSKMLPLSSEIMDYVSADDALYRAPAPANPFSAQGQDSVIDISTGTPKTEAEHE